MDVGTGFMIEKVGLAFEQDNAMGANVSALQKLPAATQFYEEKVKELTESLKELEAIVSQKQMNLRTIEEGPSGILQVHHTLGANRLQFYDTR